MLLNLFCYILSFLTSIVAGPISYFSPQFFFFPIPPPPSYLHFEAEEGGGRGEG
jgi:hypothetical protein